MRYLLLALLSFFLAWPVQAQSPASKQICPCDPTCLCPGCDCAVKPSTRDAKGSAQLAYLLSAATSDADAAAALSAALSEVRSIDESASNYASMWTLANGARQRLVVGVNCKAPEGTWLTARASEADGFASGSYVIVAWYDTKTNALVRWLGQQLQPGATAAQVEAALLPPVPAAPQYQQVFYGSPMTAGFRMVGGGCGPGGCR